MLYTIKPSPWIRSVTPLALTIGTGIGVVATAILSAAATPKALEAKKEAEEDKGAELTAFETVKTMAPAYIGVAVAGVATIGCAAGAQVLNDKQIKKTSAALLASNGMLHAVSNNFTRYKDHVAEKAPSVAKEIQNDSMVQEWEEYIHKKNADISSKLAAGRKEVRKQYPFFNGGCFEGVSGEGWGEIRRFYIEYGNGLVDENGAQGIFFDASPGDILTAFYNINLLMQNTTPDLYAGKIPLSALYEELDIPVTELSLNLFWDIDWMYDEWDTTSITFNTIEQEIETDVPNPYVITVIEFCIPPLADGYADGMDILPAGSNVGPTE